MTEAELDLERVAEVLNALAKRAAPEVSAARTVEEAEQILTKHAHEALRELGLEHPNGEGINAVH